MATRGRKPKPTELRRAEGNPGRRPLNENEPDFPPLGRTPPDGLDETGRWAWEHVNGIYHGLGILTEADRSVVETFCHTYSMLQRARAERRKLKSLLLKSKSGCPIEHPIVGTEKRLSETLLKIAPMLGLDPSSRSRFVVDRKTADDPLEKLLDGKNQGKAQESRSAVH